MDVATFYGFYTANCVRCLKPLGPYYAASGHLCMGSGVHAVTDERVTARYCLPLCSEPDLRTDAHGCMGAWRPEHGIVVICDEDEDSKIVLRTVAETESPQACK